MGHWPEGWGCCWLAASREEAIAFARRGIEGYAAWRGRWEPGFTSPEGPIVVAEQIVTEGMAAGQSGSQMALFELDMQPPSARDVVACFEVAFHAWTDLRGKIRGISQAQRDAKPGPGRRSINETLVHLGNCFWWYCSRIDDGLPEWPDSGLEPEERGTQFLGRAKTWCAERQGRQNERQTIHVPTRYPTADVGESWTLGKVLRRHAEHLWEHLRAIERDIAALP